LDLMHGQAVPEGAIVYLLFIGYEVKFRNIHEQIPPYGLKVF
jgi:hypothetical protein